MAENVGKYQIIEQIGRGGMGTIFKAHDPVLDRSVALKVISTDVEVTDELRVRFFREAQACARLSHPNIVTIYDMGEDGGRLFIVMELLEGAELRRLIAQRTTLALEDKLSVMGQVCDGLHYAHQMGIVHRDIKPSNILVQRNGQAKILDFGIAQISTTERGLTRTGLIVGTLRYISPEQARGHTDARSDMFSVGTVLYELLSLRPAFTGEGPMQILEQLRTEEPPLLSRVDPTIPPELAAIVERAMRKEPGERFADLEQMRAELEQVQRGLTEEAQRVRARVRGQRDRLVQLQAALTERIGPREDDAIPVIDERGRLATMQALERDLAGRIETHQMKIARADALAAGFQRGSELLQAGLFGDAVAEFEAIVADMPEHARAGEGLEQARAQAQAQRRRQLAAQLVQDARSALDEGAYALGLELLRQAAEIPPPAEAAEEITWLVETAEAALGAQDAVLRMRQQAERAREQMAQARRTAQARAASAYAPTLWADAEAKSSEAQAAFGWEAYAEAGAAFEAAAAAYGRFEATAGEAQQRERDAAERAREQMAQGQERAQAAAAPQYARELWEAAEGKSSEAQAAVVEKALGRAVGVFSEAVALYRQAEQAAGVARQRERRLAEEARDRAAQDQRSAAGAEADRHAPALWGDAAAKSMDAEAALAQEQYAKAAEAFDGVSAVYREARQQAREARHRQREQAEQGRQVLAERRRSARAADAAAHAAADWNDAEASGLAGEAAFTRGAYADARQVFDEGAALYRRAEERAREIVRALEVSSRVAEAQMPVGVAQDGAAAAGDSDATRLSSSNPQTEDRGATRVRPRASDAARSGAAWRWGLRPRIIVGALGGFAAIVAAIIYSWSPWVTTPGAPRPPGVLPSSPPVVSPPESPPRPDVAEKLRQQLTAAREEAVSAEARRVTSLEANARERASRTAEARRAAEHVGAPRLAGSLWAKGGTAQLSAEGALKQGAFDRAQRLFGEAERAYREAEQAATAAAADEGDRQKREAEAPALAAIRRQQSDTEQARNGTTDARRAAEQADASRYAPKFFASAQAKERDATAALGRSEYALAMRAFREAQADYQSAAQEARRGAEAAVDAARTRTLARREDAVKAEADRLAKDVFDSAQAKQAEAEGLVNRQNFAGAAQAYQDASDRYDAATARARDLGAARVKADRERARMQSEKQGGRPGSAEFDAALEQERNGSDLYARLAFPEAAERFRTAADLFARAKVRPLATAPFVSDESAQIRAVLDEFKRAIESKDLTRLRRVRPGLTGEELRGQQASFDNTSRYMLDLTVQTIQIQGNVAQARTYRKDTLHAKDGQIHLNETVATFTFRRTQDRWTIEAIK